jgi:hypothetical protein
MLQSVSRVLRRLLNQRGHSFGMRLVDRMAGASDFDRAAVGCNAAISPRRPQSAASNPMATLGSLHGKKRKFQQRKPAGTPHGIAFEFNGSENETSCTSRVLAPMLRPRRDSDVEVLARETDTPVDAVRELYRIEREKLEHSARITTFVPVLARRRVKELLLVHRGPRH